MLVAVLAMDAEPWRTIQAEGQRSTWAGPDSMMPIVWLHGLSTGPVRLLTRAVVGGLRKIGLGRASAAASGAIGRRSARRRVVRTGDQVRTRVPESYVLTNAKTVAALRHLLRTEPFDYLFRTNSSTYVNLPALRRHVEGLPAVGYYGGTPWTYDGMEYATGTSVLLSRDLVIRAVEDPDWDFGMIDDVALGYSMQRAGAGLDRFDRVDVVSASDLADLDRETVQHALVIRCRGAESRDHDVRAMLRIHELLQEQEQEPNRSSGSEAPTLGP